MIGKELEEKSAASQRPPTPINAPFLEFDLRSQIELLRGEERYQQGHTSKTLAKYPDFRLVLMVIKAGTRIPRHTAAGRISVQTIAGHIRMYVGEKLLDLPAGRLLVIDQEISHDVQAVEDSALLLTVAWPENR